MIYIKSIVIVSLNNNKFLAISTYINKDLFIILLITNIYIYINTRLNLKKKKSSTAITKVQARPSQEDDKIATQVLLIRPTHKKKHETNPITPIIQKKKLEGPNLKHQAITQYIKPNLNKSKVKKAKSYKLCLKSQKPIMQNQQRKKQKRQSARLLIYHQGP